MRVLAPARSAPVFTKSRRRILWLLTFPSHDRNSPHRKLLALDILTEVGAQRERAIIVQLLVTSPAHGIAHSLHLDLGFEF
jgi:hypothetical protein